MADETTAGGSAQVWIGRGNGEWERSGFLSEKWEYLCTDERFFHGLSELVGNGLGKREGRSDFLRRRRFEDDAKGIGNVVIDGSSHFFLAVITNLGGHS